MKQTYEHIHKVQYYETDKMGITHHSNYIRWMEEARTAFLNRFGCGYAAFEACGAVSPVLSISCRYLQTTTFEDEIKVRVQIKAYTGVRLSFLYEMEHSGTGTIVFTAESEHCFLGEQGRPVIVKKQFPQFHERLTVLAADGDEA